MKRIPFDENARDVWHDASVEVPDDYRVVLRIGIANNIKTAFYTQAGWSAIGYATHWRELPAPPKPTPKTVPHSLAHWHDPKVERPEPGKAFVVMFDSGMASWHHAKTGPDWDVVARWTYYPETAR